MLGTLAATVAVALTPVTGQPHHRSHATHHRVGCRSRACDRRADRAFDRHRKRKLARELATMTTTTASYYNDAGSTACGTHYTYGFAHLGPGEGAYTGMACGTRVRICAAQCVTATMDDHGPYVAGREYDLNETLKDAIGASDLGSVRVRVLR